MKLILTRIPGIENSRRTLDQWCSNRHPEDRYKGSCNSYALPHSYILKAKKSQIFAFSEKPSAENSKLSADSGINGV